MTENSEILVDEALKKKTILFLMGMLHESHPHVSVDGNPDYEEGLQYFTDKNAGHKKVLTIGDKSLTPRKILKEIMRNTAFSNVLVKMINDLRTAIYEQQGDQE